MPFIGTQPEVGGYSVLDALTASATASYTLQKDSANFSPASANQLLVSLNGVIQKPGSSFTISGSTLTFSSALTSSDSIDFILAMGEPLLVGTPSDGTVTTAKIATDAVTGAKIENNPTIAGNLATGGTLTSTGLITATAGMTVGNANITMSSGYGIDFTATANSSGSVTHEILDDYEKGTWTPTIRDLGGNGASGYSAQVGHYIKVGSFVFAQFRVTLTNKGSITGNYAMIGNLPFNNAGSDGGSGIINRYTNLASSHSSLSVELGGSTPGVGWITRVSGTSGSSDGYLSTSDIQNNTFMQGTLLYRTG